jgi:hypothetical protein
MNKLNKKRSDQISWGFNVVFIFQILKHFIILFYFIFSFFVSYFLFFSCYWVLNDNLFFDGIELY